MSQFFVINKNNKGSEYNIIIDIWDCEEKRQGLKEQIRKNDVEGIYLWKKNLYNT